MQKELLDLKNEIVVVTKNHSLAEIKEVYNQGFRVFGENRVQELLTKVDNDMEDISWHLIGHLQTNKVKYAVKYCDLIHSVDSLELLIKINKEAQKINRIMPVLIQVNVAKEATKFGIDPQQLTQLLKNARDLSNIDIQGIMVIGPHVLQADQVREVFTEGKQLFDSYLNFSQDNVHFKTLSMGMSQDYKIAIECGSNLLRLGHIMFGLGGGNLF